VKLVVALLAAMLLSSSAALAEQTAPAQQTPAAEQTNPAEHTPPLVFVSEFIHDLTANEKLRAQAESELQTQKDNTEKNTSENGSSDPVEQNTAKSAAVIRGSTLIINELKSQVATLKGMTLNKPFDQLPTTIAGLDEYKIKAHQKLILMAKALVAKPAAGVDYKAMGDDVPKILGLLQDFDHTLYDITPVVFATLVEGDALSEDEHAAQSSAQSKRLTITKAQRDALVKSLDDGFGKKLDGEKQNYLVGSAANLKKYLTQKDYKSSDEQ
jgi:hypothetical protein